MKDGGYVTKGWQERGRKEGGGRRGKGEGGRKRVGRGGGEGEEPASRKSRARVLGYFAAFHHHSYKI